MIRMLVRGLLLAALVAAGPVQARPKPGTVSVQLLALNDFHGNLEPPSGTGGRVNGVEAGGAEYLATHLKRAAGENRNTLVVAAGDMMGGSPLLSAQFDEAPTVEALDAMGLDITSMGNHEFDNGPDPFLRRIQGDCVARPRRPCPVPYQYLAANVTRADGSPLLPAMAVRKVGGVKIGFIGAVLQRTGSIIAADSARDLRFAEESIGVNAAAAQLERQGVHAIVLLIHQGGRQQAAQPGPPADPNGCADFTGDILPVLRRLSPSIKVVVSGHTHQFYNCTIDGRTVTSTGSFGRMFTKLTLTIDKRRDTIIEVKALNVVATRDVPKDPVQTAILEKYRPRAKARAD